MSASSSEYASLRIDFSCHGSEEGKIVSPHTIYCKRHRVRREDPSTPTGRTLFSLGWPPYVSKDQIEAIFSRAGTVTDALLQYNVGQVVVKEETVIDEGRGEGGGGGGRVAYVVFSQPDELERALVLCRGGETIGCEVGKTGMAKWCEEYAQNRPKVTNLDSTANRVVGVYDRKMTEQEKSRKRFSQPDNEGWVTVASRKPQLVSSQRIKKKKKKKELVNFYQFQQRETKREAIAELRRKFHKDKERVAELRAQRKFRPF